MVVSVVLASAAVGFALGYTLGYPIGRADGEDKAARHYEAKRRKWATNEKGGAK